MTGETFGHDFKQKYFSYLNPGAVPVNHGSFGAAPACVIDKQESLCEEVEDYPDQLMFVDLKSKYVDQLKSLGEYLNIDYHNLALVTNTTVGVNTVLRSFPWDFNKDKLLFHSTSFQSCQNTVRFLSEYFGLRFDVVELAYPLEDAEVVAKFEAKLSTGEYRLCMFDMITSMPGVRLPYEQLTKLCQKYNVLSLLDGAHSAGQVDLRFLDEIQPDFMSANLHKWLFTPRSSGILYVNPKHHAVIQSLPISSQFTAEICHPIAEPVNEQQRNHNREILINKFYFTASVSYYQYFCVKTAIEFRRVICGGEKKIHEYQSELRKDAIDAVIDIFGPGAKLMENSTKTLAIPGMFNVSLPLRPEFKPVLSKALSNYDYSCKLKAKCEKIAITEKKFAPVAFHNDKLWVRFSVQIYNELEDYKLVAQRIKEAVETAFWNEYNIL
ncbi:LAMI_0D02080g1_1 [Lachancea mirantina]|uniref:LAMI_0D02080g1_1 n=1 Tax=Lachancea mirantina TaxID=1230905 RepID=A0A1G4J904_9SACH|nr:LAMI_0D02080g1_1 [Lachancea mirantina]